MQAAYANGQVYIVRTELARTGTTASALELNSIYWARINPNFLSPVPGDSRLLCTSSMRMEAKGVIVGGNSLHLAYPSVAVTADGTGYITYSYAGSEMLPDFSRAYPGN